MKRRVIRGIDYQLKSGYIPFSEKEEDAVFNQASLFHRFVVHGKKSGCVACVTDFETHTVVGTLLSVKGISVFVDSSWESDFLKRMDIAYASKTSKLGISTAELVAFPFVEESSFEDGFVQEELNSFEYDDGDIIQPTLACDLAYKVYKDKPHEYELYKIVDFASAQSTYKALFECTESTLESQPKGKEIDILGATKCKGTDFSPTDKPEKVVDKSVKPENKLEELKKLGFVNYSEVDFTDPEHAIIYKKLCDVENLLKSLSLEKVVKETIEKTLEGYIVTRNIKTYSGKGEFAPAKKRKLTAEQIIELREQGVSVKDICEKAGISKQAVYAILKKGGIK